MTIPHAIFGGLALIAVSIYFSVGSLPVTASGGLQKVQICGYSNTERYRKPDAKINCAIIAKSGNLQIWRNN